jgi:glycolate dehydrogenase FAD-linked subunit
MEPQLFQKLRDIVGNIHCSKSLEERHCYSYDSSKQTFLPDAVVLPDSTTQVVEILQLANNHSIPVVARGAGSGTTGGALPIKGGIVVSTSRMNKILEVDSANLIGIVEPGVVTGEFQQQLKRRKLMYPPDPASLKFCTMGGNVAECAGGPSAVKYGVTKDSIIGLEVVLADGSILNTGTRTEKGVVGYDLTRLFTGSEGTLGIITKIITRLQPLPERKETFLLQSNSLERATALVATILKQNIQPCTLEYMDKTAIQLVSGLLPEKIPDTIQAMLIIEIDGSKKQVSAQCDQLQELVNTLPSCTLQRATNEEEVEKIWLARRSISPACFQLSSSKTSEDVVVPRSKIPELVSFCETLAQKIDLTILTFGHAGDGNIHVNMMSHDDSSTEKQKALNAKAELFKKVLSLNGTLSGEHGVGITKADFIHLELDAVSIRIMQQLKTLFDPKNILNPGKIFPTTSNTDKEGNTA